MLFPLKYLSGTEEKKYGIKIEMQLCQILTFAAFLPTARFLMPPTIGYFEGYFGDQNFLGWGGFILHQDGYHSSHLQRPSYFTTVYGNGTWHRIWGPQSMQ